MSPVDEGELQDLAADTVATLRGLGADDDAIRHRLAQATMLHAVAASDDVVGIIGRIASSGKVWDDDLAGLAKLTGQGLAFAPAPLSEPSDEEVRVTHGPFAGANERAYKIVEALREQPCVVRSEHTLAKAEKPPRIRYFELPMQTAVVRSDTPFIIVVDRCPDDLVKSIRDMGNSLRAATGAKGVVVIRQEVSLDE